METLDVAQGRFALRRYPHRDRSTLRAWDAADEYLLAHLADEVPHHDTASWAIINDGFGALACALADREPVSISDSYLSHRAAGANLETNGINPGTVVLASALDDPLERIDVLVVKVPKTLALLDDELRRLRPALHEASVVIGAGMARHIHNSTLEVFELVIGSTTTSRAKKKARLIMSSVDPQLDVGPTPYPSMYDLPGGMHTVNHANVFSRQRLDAGTALLLQNLPSELHGNDIVDVGCGNGALGLTLARDKPGATLRLIDESFHAVASAAATFAANGVEADVVVGDCLDAEPDASADLVVSNPPFHADHAVGDAVAWQIFTGASRVLRPGGEIRIVGNRHLGYHIKLQRIFGNCQVVASNPKFVVLSAHRI